MSIEVDYFCPLGNDCEKIDGDKVRRCRWYYEVHGDHPQTGERISEWQCAIYWAPMMLIENSKTNRGQTQAIEDFRNKTVKGQEVFNSLIEQSLQIKKLENKQN
jgi:hypothetical protein